MGFYVGFRWWGCAFTPDVVMDLKKRLQLTHNKWRETAALTPKRPFIMCPAFVINIFILGPVLYAIKEHYGERTVSCEPFPSHLLSV